MRNTAKAHRKKVHHSTSHKNKKRRATLTLGNPKMLHKSLRAHATATRPRVNPYTVLLLPVVIAPDSSDEKPVIADAGSIVRRCDQTVAYRNRVSPITHNADEVLVQYGKADAPVLGWITNKLPATTLAPVQGPTFLARTRDETLLTAWDQVRLKVARMRTNDASNWLGSWLATNGTKYSQLIWEVLRSFEGRPIKDESADVRFSKLLYSILNVEIDMKTLKANIKHKQGKKSAKSATEKSAKKTTAKAPKKAVTKTVKKHAEAERVGTSSKAKTAKTAPASKKTASGDFNARSREFDNFEIRRLIKENPRRAGSQKAEVWATLQKGTTVGEFVGGEGSRSIVAHYLRSGWIKLVRPRKTRHNR